MVAQATVNFSYVLQLVLHLDKITKFFYNKNISQSSSKGRK